MIRNVVFDMGQVLLNYNPTFPCLRHTGGDSEAAAAVRHAIFDTPDWYVSLDGGEIGEEELLRRSLNRLESPLLKGVAAAVMKDWDLDGLWPKEGMARVAEALHQRGYKLYILSNAGLRLRSYMYKIPGIHLFDGVMVSAEEKLLKPSAEIFARLCDRYGLKAEECLFIDDMPANVEGARKAGLEGYCFDHGDVERLSQFLDALQ